MIIFLGISKRDFNSRDMHYGFGGLQAGSLGKIYLNQYIHLNSNINEIQTTNNDIHFR